MTCANIFNTWEMRFFEMQIAWTATKASLVYCCVMLLFFVPALFIQEETETVEDLTDVLLPLPEEKPDFAEILDVQMKKQMFFDYMEPYVDAINAEIIQQRKRVEEIRGKIVSFGSKRHF